MSSTIRLIGCVLMVPVCFLCFVGNVQGFIARGNRWWDFFYRAVFILFALAGIAFYGTNVASLVSGHGNLTWRDLGVPVGSILTSVDLA